MPARSTSKHMQEKISILVNLFIKHGTKHGSMKRVIKEAESLNVGVDPRSIYRYAKIWKEGKICGCGKYQCHMAPQCW